MTSVLATLRSELTKILTLPSVWIVTGILLALNLFFQYQSMAITLEALETLDADGMHWWYGRPVSAEQDVLEMMGAVVFNPGIFFPVLGAVIAGAEFRTGQLGLSVLAVPSRPRLVAAKTIAVALYVLALGVICVAMTIVFTYLAVRDWQPGLVWRPEALANLAGSVLFIVAFTLTAFGITLITRRVLTGILVMGGFTAVTISQVVAVFAPAVDALTPLSAARNLLLQGDGVDSVGGAPFSSSPEVGGVVLIGWVVATFLGALVAIQQRDAR